MGIRWHCFCLCICHRLTVFWNGADAPLPSVSWDGAALFVFRVLLFDVRLWRPRRAPDYTFRIEVFLLKSCFMWNWNQVHHHWLTTIKDPEECEAFNHCDQIFDTGRRAVQSKSNIMHKCLNTKKMIGANVTKGFQRQQLLLVSYPRRGRDWPNDHRQTAKSGLGQSISAPLYLCSDQLISASWTLTHVHVDMWSISRYKARPLLILQTIPSYSNLGYQ